MPEKSNELSKTRKLDQARRFAAAILRLGKRSGEIDLDPDENLKRQMFTPEELAYAEANPASQQKIKELVGVIRTLAHEKGQHYAGTEGGVLAIYEDDSPNAKDALIVYYNRAGDLKDAVQNQQENTPVAEASLSLRTATLEPGTIAGFGWPDRPTHIFVDETINIYETEDPANPYSAVHQRKVRTIEARVFSELLPEQSLATATIPATDHDIEHVLGELAKAAISNPPEEKL